LADVLHSNFPDATIDLAEGEKGAFEVSVGNKSVFSKKESNISLFDIDDTKIVSSISGLDPQPKVMLKTKDGFIMSKHELQTVEGEILWQFSKSPGVNDQISATAQIFEDHGYEVVEWDDNQEATDGSKIFTDG